MWFSNRSDGNRAVQSEKMVSSFRFWIQKVEELYYPSSETRGADQLRSKWYIDYHYFHEPL